MALLFFDGFETASSNTTFLRPGWVPNSGVASATGRNGGKAIVGIGTGDTLRRAIPPSAQLIVGVAKNMESGAFGSSNDGDCILTILSDAGGTEHLSVNVSSTGQLHLRRGSGSGTVIATSTLIINQITWFYCEVKASIADAGGICIVRVNGVEFINFTGDTKNGGTSTNIDAIRLGSNPIRNIRSDDLVIMNNTGGSFNDFIGDRTIRAIRPNANGATNQWAGSDGNSTDNYLLVDEDPFSSTDYTGSPTAGERDIYGFSDLSITGAVDAVQVLAYAAKSDSGARSIKTLTRSTGGTVLSSADAALQTTYAVVDSPILQTDADAAAWTVASVNSAQFGVEVV